MADLTGDEKMILMAILIVVFVVTIYLELRLRKVKLGKRIVSSKVKKDQAFNSLHTTKAVRNKLKIERIDTLKADYMIQRAEDALESGEADACIDLCQKARDDLLKSKRAGAGAAPEALASDERDEVLPSVAAAGATTRRLRNEPKPVDNLMLQARFELKIAKDDLDTYSGDSDVKQKAASLIEEAERHMDAGEYQKSLSNSFKVRKMLSGEVEEEKAPTTDKVRPRAEEEGAQKEMILLEKAVEEDWEPSAALKGTCKGCGTAYDADDVFCHYCGKPLKAMKCPHCGADLKGIEKYCRKCGKPVNG